MPGSLVAGRRAVLSEFAVANRRIRRHPGCKAQDKEDSRIHCLQDLSV